MKAALGKPVLPELDRRRAEGSTTSIVRFFLADRCVFVRLRRVLLVFREFDLTSKFLPTREGIGQDLFVRIFQNATGCNAACQSRHIDGVFR